MQLSIIFVALFTAAVTARDFTLYSEANFGDASHGQTRWDDDACWNMNGKGDHASSVRGKGCKYRAQLPQRPHLVVPQRMPGLSQLL